MEALLTSLIYVLAFVAVVILAQAIAGLLFASGDRTRRINRRLTMLSTGMNRDDVYKNLIRQSAAPHVGGARVLRAYKAAERYCHQAGLSVPLSRIAVISAAGAAVLWLVALSLASSRHGVGFLLNWAMSLVGAAGLSAPSTRFWILRLRP